MFTEITKAIKDTIDPESGGGKTETFICIIALILIVGMFAMEAMGLETPGELKTTLIVLISFMVGKNTKTLSGGTQEVDNENNTS